MQVIIDGVEYAPRHSASIANGKIKSLSQLMVEGRAHMHLTLEQVATQTGCTVNQIHSAEGGTEVLPVVLKLAKFYGIPLEQVSRAVLRD
jgi:transcriptional regulator with XRE-family HTH domain